MKKFLTSLFAAALFLGVLTHPAEAQTSSIPETTSSSQKNITENTGMWGLLGLLGFLGLIKWKNARKTAKFSADSTTANR